MNTEQTREITALLDRLSEGCVCRPRRWSGDTHADLGGTVDEAATDALIAEAWEEITTLRASLTALVVAAGRMRDGWAEGDAAYRQQLWRALHQAADDADERHGVYPL